MRGARPVGVPAHTLLTIMGLQPPFRVVWTDQDPLVRARTRARSTFVPVSRSTIGVVGVVLFRDVRLFDGSGRAPFAGAVPVEGTSISAVDREGDHMTVPSGFMVVSGRGATLMPGLVEAHAHLTFPSSVDRVFTGLDLPPEQHLLVAAHHARVLLDYGFHFRTLGGVPWSALRGRNPLSGVAAPHSEQL